MLIGLVIAINSVTNMNTNKHHYLILLLVSSFVLLQSCTKRTRQEPYAEIEKTQITLTYLVSEKTMFYKREGGAILFGTNPRLKAYCDITNTSEHDGVFKFYATLSSQGNSVEFEDEKFIKSGESVRLSEEKEINPFSFETNVAVDKWGVTAPTITESKEVIKYRTVEY